MRQLGAEPPNLSGSGRFKTTVAGSHVLPCTSTTHYALANCGQCARKAAGCTRSMNAPTTLVTAMDVTKAAKGGRKPGVVISRYACRHHAWRTCHRPAACLFWEAILRLLGCLAVVSDLTPSRYKSCGLAGATASVLRAPEDFSASSFSNSDADLIGIRHPCRLPRTICMTLALHFGRIS